MPHGFQISPETRQNIVMTNFPAGFSLLLQDVIAAS